jgi:hypothetical protein
VRCRSPAGILPRNLQRHHRFREGSTLCVSAGTTLDSRARKPPADSADRAWYDFAGRLAAAAFRAQTTSATWELEYRRDKLLVINRSYSPQSVVADQISQAARSRTTNVIFDAGRRELQAFSVLAIGLVLLRSVVAVRYEGFYFDSDQAIVGLMAKHIAEGRHFPIFYYGLNYILAVEAWIIAPFFRVARPSVALMRLPFVALNGVVAVWLVAAIRRWHATRPAIAFVAALPFILPTPAVSNQLLELAGACVEPFVYVLCLWQLRRRPLAFGALLAVAFLHREFAAFTVPALLLAEGWSPRELWNPATARRLGWIAAGFGVVWLLIDDLRMHVEGGALALQAMSLRGQMCLDATHLVSAVRLLVGRALPSLYGAAPVPVRIFRMDTSLVAGSAIVGLLVGAAFVLMAGRFAWRSFVHRSGSLIPDRSSDLDRRGSFGAYLAWVGAFTAAAYPLSCNVTPESAPLLRYLTLALLVPVGAAAVFFQRERSRAVRIFVAGVFVVWGAANLVDNIRLIRAVRAEPPANERRGLTEYLIAHRIRYARAIYWDAYVVDFLSRERVVTSSVDVVRVPEYQKVVDEHTDAAVVLERVPCEGSERFASWCIQRD